MLTQLIISIAMGWLRHAVSGAGVALVTHAVTVVNGMPVVQNLESAAAGGVLIAGGMILSAAHKVKTKSGPIYNTN